MNIRFFLHTVSAKTKCLFSLFIIAIICMFFLLYKLIGLSENLLPLEEVISREFNIGMPALQPVLPAEQSSEDEEYELYVMYKNASEWRKQKGAQSIDRTAVRDILVRVGDTISITDTNLILPNIIHFFAESDIIELVNLSVGYLSVGFILNEVSSIIKEYQEITLGTEGSSIVKIFQNGGTVKAITVFLESTVFKQDGGVFDIINLNIGSILSLENLPLYELLSGQLSTENFNIENGIFKQSGGRAEVTGELRLANAENSSALIWLLGGFFEVANVVAGDGKSTLRYDGGALEFSGNFSVNELEVGYERSAEVQYDSLGYTLDVRDTLNIGTLESGIGTFTIETNSLAIPSIVVGDQGIGTLNQLGATLDTDELIIGNAPTANGTYNISDGSLNAQQINVGVEGTGIFDQSGGTVKGGKDEDVSLNVSLGVEPGSNGSYLLRDGILNGERINIGMQGSGTFDQLDGIIEITQDVLLGLQPDSEGAYTLFRGELHTQTMNVGVGGRGIFNQLNGTVEAGNVSLGVEPGSIGYYFLRNGATNAVQINLGVEGTGILDQYDGILTAQAMTLAEKLGSEGTYNLHKGTFITKEINVGVEGRGFVAQRSGIIQAEQGENLGVGIGVASGGEGIYSILNDSILYLDTLHVGKEGGTGHFEHIGGTVTTGRVFVGLNSGTGDYALGLKAADSSIPSITNETQANQSPILETNVLYVGYSITHGDQSRGTFSLSEGGILKTSSIVLGAHEIVSSVPLFDVPNGIFDFNGGEIIGLGTDAQPNSDVFDTIVGNGKLVLSKNIFSTDVLVLGFQGGDSTVEFRGGKLVVSDQIIMSAGKVSFLFNADGETRLSDTIQAKFLEYSESKTNIEIKKGIVIDNSDFLEDIPGCHGNLLLSDGQLKIETLASSSAFALFFNGGTLDVSTLPNSSIPFETVNLGYTSASNISMNDTDYNFDSVLNLNIGYEGTGVFVQKAKDMVNHNLKLALAVKGSTGGGTTPKGTYTLENKNLTIKSLAVGKDGIGTFNQSGNVEVGDSIALGGDSPDSHGEYNLESGSLTAGEIFVGKNGTGIFNQNGVVSLTGNIKISNGEYNQNFGILSAYSISISNGIFNQFDTVALTSGITLNGGKYNWNAGGLIANSITVGQYGTSIFSQSDTLTLGGEIILGSDQSGFGTYNQNTGALTAKKITVGDAGTGIFNQFDNVSVIGSEKGEAQVIVGTSLGGFGTYNQNTGALTAKKITVGVAGTGIFNQSDTVSVTGEINDGESQVILGETPGSSGTYNLDSGNLTADTMLLGLEGKGTFIQNTGLVQASGSLGFMALGVVGGSNGTYAMLNGSLSNFFSIQVGRTGGNGIFEHIGGTVDTVDRLFIGFHGGTGYYKLGMNPGDSSIESIRQMQVANPNPVLDLKNLYIGYSLFNSEESNGTFSLFEGGTLNAQNTVIGVKETAKGDEESSTAVSQGQFNLNGGSHITKVLAIGSDQGSGTYNVNGGKLNVRQADLGVLGTNNEFNINSNSADITVLEYFSLGENLTFSAVAVSSITMMSETTFTFRATDQNALAGLNNLDLIIAGENVRLEIGSQDFGAIVEGFNLNFALNALMFSGDGIRSLLLENNFDNQPEFDDEAFYVKDIIADDTVQQATIDGGGSITVYYMNKQGNISFTNGTFIQVPAEEETSFGFSPLSLSRGVLPITPFTNSVPEPSVYWLTFSGVLLLLRYIKQNV